MPRSTARKAQLPLCTYGAACTRKGCIYRHPSKAAAAAATKSDEVCKPFLAGMCGFGHRCHNRHPSEAEVEALRRHYASFPCRFGDECRSQGCLFWHPGDADVHINEVAEQLAQVPAGLSAGCSAPLCVELEGTSGSDLGLPPRGVETLPQFPIRTQDEHQGAQVGEGRPTLGPADWTPNAAATDWTPNAAAADWAPNAAAADWAPNATAVEWHPNAGASTHGCGTAAAGMAWPRPGDETALTCEAGTGAASPFSWAAVAGNASAHAGGGTRGSDHGKGGASHRPISRTPQTVRIPPELWLPPSQRVDSAAAFAIADPMARFRAVNEGHERRAASQPLPLTLASLEEGGSGYGRGANGERGGSVRTVAAAVGVIDLHYQSERTAPIVLAAELMSMLARHAEVWIITGTGHHTNKQSHQRSAEGGVLSAVVAEYLERQGCGYRIGKDHNGRSGAFLLTRRDVIMV
jgi:hypothetical protein